MKHTNKLCNKTLLHFVCVLLFCSTSVFGQALKPGFDKSEYIETLKMNEKTHVALDKWTVPPVFPLPEDYKFLYRSPRVGFDNIWDLWINEKRKIAVIAVQGTIATQVSFLANIYAAMIPATGSLQLDTNFKFDYTLATNEHAAVHAGWLIAMAYLSPTILHKIDSCYNSGIRDFILTGHSQGGGITFLLTSYLRYLQAENKIPKDIRFKTYCSAAPKPGNLYYAYDYENITKGGWAYNVVNTADWVPEVPFSVQTIADFTDVNPFKDAKTLIKKQKFPKNLALRYAYNQMSKPSEKAQRNYEKYLGKMVSKSVKKTFPNFKAPQYYKSNYYVRAGNTIALFPDSVYYKIYDSTKDKSIWLHHLPRPYLYLIEHWKE